MDQSRIDWPSFIACVTIIALVCLPIAIAPDATGYFLQSTYDWIAREFGILYLLASVAAIGFLVWIAASRYGALKLGQDQDEPEFSQISWVAMLFCAGVGAGLIYWCATEWAYYYQAPPFGAEPRSAEAAEWASTYGLFHWGFTAWAFYCLPTIAIAYPYYVKKMNILRFSVSCNWYLKGKEQGPVARAIDLFFMIALIGGAASSLGFSTPMIAACLAWLFGIEPSFNLEMGVVVLCVLLFAGSVWLGLKKGIKRLSDINLVLAFGLLLFILLVGPTAFLLKTSLNGVGLMAQNFLRMNFWTDPFSDSGFVESWTVFYWAWWVAYAPYIGLFVTRISRGRTIRQVITGMLLFGSLGSWVFYMIIGNYALYLELAGTLDFTGIMNSIDGNAAIVAMLEQLPLTPLVIAVFSAIAIIFAATTYDSASYTLASSATLNLKAGDDPARWHRAFWAFAFGLMPVALMYIGGLRVMQVIVLIASLPILLIGVVMSISLVKTLQADVRASN
ncbi:MAG: BCCT family transporter [Gammaproteobacteria bacterium]|nr:BCCT family transporter [Gammaproteobacteria bacterium]MDH3806521.1 BCCT family transporter [Gammaproteobacteria bacterium]